MKKTLRTRRRLVVHKAFLAPEIEPPTYSAVLQCVKIPARSRTADQNHIIVKYLLSNSFLVRMLERPERVEQAAREAIYQRLHKGEVLFLEGDEPDGFYLVLKGSVDVIIRMFLVAEDCSVNDDEIVENPDFAKIMELMELSPSVDRLRKVNTLTEDQIFGHIAYLLERRRSATIICSSDNVDLIKFNPDIFQKTSALLLAKDLLSENIYLMRKIFPRLRENQITQIASLGEIIDLPKGRVIKDESSIGRNLYIVKKGTLARYRMVDFTPFSFRKIKAPFEKLELHFPDGQHPVHTDDIALGQLFSDPANEELVDSKFSMKATSDVELLSLNLEYFKIVVGEEEFLKVKQELKNVITDEDAIKIWINLEKQKLWNNFKHKEVKDSRKAIKSELLFKRQQVMVRIPAIPKSLKFMKPKKVVPYVSKSLR